jgi:adenylate cyclase
VEIIYMDESSYHELDQDFAQPWDRALHAQLLDRLTDDGVRAVIFDIIFSGAGPDPEADKSFLDALKRNGHTILAGDYQISTPTSGPGVSLLVRKLTLPHAPFMEAAAGWGMAQLQADDDFLVRQHYHSDQNDSYPSLTWASVQHLDALPESEADTPLLERWVRYYGKPETIPATSYRDALLREVRPPGFYRDKIVFVGARPITGDFIERRDEQRSPLTGLDQYFAFMPNVEVHATELLNLLRDDWLRRLPPGMELGIMVLTALLSPNCARSTFFGRSCRS